MKKEQKTSDSIKSSVDISSENLTVGNATRYFFKLLFRKYKQAKGLKNKNSGVNFDKQISS